MNRTSLSFPVLIFVLIGFVSCQKEVSVDTTGGGGATSIVGAWKFVNMNVTSEAVVEESDGLLVAKAINLSEYVTKNNAGTITFTDTKMASTDLAYTISDTILTKLYLNGLLVNELATPFDFNVPPTSGENAYTRIGTDSLYFPNGGLNIGGTNPNEPAGAKFRFEGNKLILTAKANSSQTTVDMGVTTTEKLAVVAIITLQKQ